MLCIDSGDIPGGITTDIPGGIATDIGVFTAVDRCECAGDQMGAGGGGGGVAPGHWNGECMYGL